MNWYGAKPNGGFIEINRYSLGHPPAFVFLYSDWRRLVQVADVGLWLYHAGRQRSGKSAGATAAAMFQTSCHIKDTSCDQALKEKLDLIMNKVTYFRTFLKLWANNRICKQVFGVIDSFWHQQSILTKHHLFLLSCILGPKYCENMFYEWMLLVLHHDIASVACQWFAQRMYSCVFGECPKA